MTMVMRRALRTDEAGFGLIEVLVSALLVATVSLGVLALFDSASATSGRSRAQTQASGLAQQDQDRMRAMSPSNLAGLAGTTPPPVDTDVGGAQFQVTSKVDWAADTSSGAVTCSGSTGSVSYLKITTEVTGGSMPPGKKVEAHSFVSMPVGSQGGVLRVRVRKADGTTGVEDVDVTVTGPGGTRNGQTDADGCAVFGALSVGSYDVSVSKAGHTDLDGEPNPQQPAQGVYAGQTSDVNFTLDQVGKFSAKFWTFANGEYIATEADRVTVTNGAFVKKFGDPRQPGQLNNVQSEIETPGLTDLGAPYQISVGDCTQEHEFLAYSPVLNVTIGGDRDVWIPLRGLNQEVEFDGNDLQAGTAARLHIKRLAEPGCDEVNYEIQQTVHYDHDRVLMGLPEGVYDICAEYTRLSDGKTFRRRFDQVSDVTIGPPTSSTNPGAQVRPGKINIRKGGGDQGTCPG
jgi:Tfp pilus assembly protein PilV